MEYVKRVLKEIKQEFFIVLTFSGGITALIPPLTIFMTRFEFVISFRDIFLMFICCLFISLGNYKKDKPVVNSIRNLITIIAFTLLLLPTMGILNEIAGVDMQVPIISYVISYLTAILLYTIKNTVFHITK